MNFAHIMEAHIGLVKCREKNVLQLWQGALRDGTKNDCVGD